MSEINKAIRDYLCEYIDRSDPGFAVMLKAPWGAGKTHLIKEVINEIEGEKPLYVSLFGVGSMEEVEQAIFMANLPMLGTDWAKAVGRVGKMALKLLPVDFKGIKPEDFLKLELPQTLVFDDLERTGMAPREVLGAINGFVEHQGRNVILLANEEKLWGEESLKEKEKVIGRTLTVVADIDAALDALFGKLGGNVKAFLSDNRTIVIEIFKQAGYNNLRTLEQALWEFERLYDVLEKRLLKKTEGMVALLRLFLALTLEVKAGKLGLADLKLRGGNEFGLMKLPEILEKLVKKYPNARLVNDYDGSVLSSELAISIIWDGAIDREQINQSLAQHRLFVEPKDEPEWQTVLRVWHREAADVETAFKAMEHKFKTHAYTDPATLLYVFSAWLDLREIGLSEKTAEALEAECSAYIKSVESNKTLTARQFGHGTSDLYGYTDTGAMGLMFPRGDDHRSEAFWQLYEEMQRAQDRLLEGKFLDVCAELLRIMNTDPDKFGALLSDTKSGGKYGFNPVLKAMDVEVFVDQWLGLEIGGILTVFQTLGRRYETPRGELKLEQDWFRLVVQTLEVRAKGLSGVEKYQLESKIKSMFSPILKEWDKAKKLSTLGASSPHA